MSTTIPTEKPEVTVLPSRAQIRDAELTRREKREALQPPKHSFDWTLFLARVKYWLWILFTKTIVTIIYLEIVSQGIIHVFEEMGKRFWKIPGFAFLNDYEATHRITIAHVFALIPLIATWVLWWLLLRMYMAPDRFEQMMHRYKHENSRRVVLIIGFIVIVADAGLFAASFSMSSWGDSTFSATAVLATALYVAVIAFVSLVSMFLGDAVTDLKTKKEEK